MTPGWAMRGTCELSATMAEFLPAATARSRSFKARMPLLLREPRAVEKPNSSARRAMYSPSRLALTITTPDSRRIW
jgi:hypothetical protein